MTTHHRQIKYITLEFTPVNVTGTGENFECQVQSWNIENNTDDGERYYAQCPDGEFREEPEPDYALALTFFADWRSEGISDYLWTHKGESVEFTLDHHPETDSHVRWTGVVRLKAPSVGGERPNTEMSEVTLPIVGEPEYSRGDA